VRVHGGKNERSNTKGPNKREPLFVRYLLKGRWTTCGWGTEETEESGTRKTGCYSEKNRLTSLRFSESRILNRLAGSSCRLLNRKPDGGALREHHQHCQPGVSHRRLPCASVYSRLCHAKYHLPYRDVYYAALNLAIHMGCRRTREPLYKRHTQRVPVLNLELYPGATRDAFS